MAFCAMSGILLRAHDGSQRLVGCYHARSKLLKLGQSFLSRIRRQRLNRVADHRHPSPALQQALDRAADAVFRDHAENDKLRPCA